MELNVLKNIHLLRKSALSNQAGIDVWYEGKLEKDCVVNLQIAVEIPAGHVGYIMPRSSTAKKLKLSTKLVPIDPGYTGDIHAFCNVDNPVEVSGYIFQLVVMPVVHVTPVDGLQKRNTRAFGSSDVK